MATIAVGDVHGQLRALQDVLALIRGACGPEDTVVFLGDYIDRGPDTKGCVDAILEFRRSVEADVVCLLGNHEDWFRRTMRDYTKHSWLLGMDAFPTIRSYSPDAEAILRDAMSSLRGKLYSDDCPLPYEALFESMPPDHVRFFEELRLYHQSADCICAHGGLDPEVTRLDEQDHYSWMWGGSTFPDAYAGQDVVVYGHRNNAVVDETGWPMPAAVRSTIGIDTISHGVLTAIRLPDRRLFQSGRYERRRSSHDR